MSEQLAPDCGDSVERLQTLRGELDEIDERFLDALRQRIECCVRIALCKNDFGVAVIQPKRIAFVKERAAQYGQLHGIDPGFLDRLYDLIIGETCRVEAEVMTLAVE